MLEWSSCLVGSHVWSVDFSRVMFSCMVPTFGWFSCLSASHVLLSKKCDLKLRIVDRIRQLGSVTDTTIYTEQKYKRPM